MYGMWMLCKTCCVSSSELWQSHAMTTRDPLPSSEILYAYAEASREFLPFLPAADVHTQTHMHTHIHAHILAPSFLFYSSSFPSCLLSGVHIKETTVLHQRSSCMDFTTPSCAHNQHDVYKTCKHVAVMAVLLSQIYIFPTLALNQN